MNGGMEIDFPVLFKDESTGALRTALGRGGPLVRAVTTNGAVRIRER
ncbi:MAG: hypothetical protein ACRENH_14850 [Gemmatimonadaceae bacterium]